MFTVAILSQKGGTGKTTLALHLAVAAEKAGQLAAVVDLDPQASAAGWKDSRQAGDSGRRFGSLNALAASFGGSAVGRG